MAFDYDIMYVRGDSIPHVDALSRMSFDDEDLPEPSNAWDGISEESFVQWTETDILSATEIMNESRNDPLLSSIMKRIEQNKWSNCSVPERPFKAVRDTLSVEDGVLCRGDVLVPPMVLRTRILDAVHGDVHSGVIATRNRLK